MKQKQDMPTEGESVMRMKAYMLWVTLILALVVCAASFAANPPGLMFSTVLNGVKMLPNNGHFYLYHIQAVFLPDAQSKTIYAYNPDDGGALWAVLSTADGQELYRYDFWAQKLKEPYWLLGSYRLTNLENGENLGSSSRVPLQQGDYVLDFYLDSGKFYTFDFAVSKIEEGGGFSTNTAYFLDGPWEEWSYLYYPDADASRQLQWKVWLREKAAKSSNKTVKPAVTLSRGGTVIATSRPYTNMTPRQDWMRHEFSLIHPMQGTSGGAMFLASSLLGTDGQYELKLALDNKPYGTWRFSVQNGKLVPHPRTNRGQADPLTFVEGGVDAFWYCSGGSAPAPAATQPAAASTTSEPAQPAASSSTAGEAPIPNAVPISVGGHTMVPLRCIFEWLGAEVSWEGATQTITGEKGSRTVILSIGSSTATIDGSPVSLAAPAMKHQGSTYVPLRFIAEAMGAEVKWDAATSTIRIIDGDRVGTIQM